jgi:beta-lactamase class C
VSKLNFTLLLSIALLGAGSAPARPDTVKGAVDAAVSPVMKKYGIPGMTVGIVVNADRYVFDYGVASLETHAPVTDATLFEIGSISKTFTATLAAWAAADGQLSLADRTSKYLPVLRGTKFGQVTLLSLGTYTPGGLPLQLPDDVTNDEQLMQYLQQWRPAYAPGTYRTYSNPSVGVLGIITAKAMHQDFVTLVQQRLFPALGMTSSYINLPQTKVADYAQGYTSEGKPIRMSASVISNETYGIKTTAGDLLRFLEANMMTVAANDALARAITETHIGYFKTGAMIQDLIWEQYAYPVSLEALLQGNSPQIIFNATPVTAIRPPMAPHVDVLVNKTGSTNGFGAYVAFIPQEHTGIVILANKSYPIAARVALAYELLSSLETRR